MMKLTGQNPFTKSLSGGYKITNGSHVRKNGRGWKLTVDERVKNGDGE